MDTAFVKANLMTLDKDLGDSVIKRNEDRPGYKETKIGWIPKEWGCQLLKEITGQSLVNGLFKKPDEYGSGTLLVNVIDTYGGVKVDSSTLGLVRTSPSDIAKYANRSGDLFFVRSSLKLEGVGNCCLLLDDQPKSVFECHLIRLRPDKDIVDPLFVAYLCRSAIVRKQLLARAQMTTMTTLPQGCLEQCLLPLPPLRQQMKIVEILSDWDKCIEQTRTLIEAKKRRKKALMQQLLMGKKRLSNFGKSEIRQSYRFFHLPEEWECPQIRDIAQECSERSIDSRDLPVLSCSKHLGFVKSTEYFGKQVFSEDTSNYKVIRRGWFGYPSNHVEEGSIGLLLTHEAGLVSPIYTVFKCNSDVVPEFLFAVFKTDTFRHIFAVSTNASVDRRGSLRWNEFSLIRVPLPSIEEQQAIVEVLSLAQTDITNLETRLSALERQKRGLMQKLLTGEVRVKV